jgi:7-cyano-7-deazaguanine synthase
MEPAAILMSGGLDRTVLAHSVARRLNRAPLVAVSFNYGQRHVRELDCARTQARLLGVADHLVLDVRFLQPLLRGGSALIQDGAPVPDLAELSQDELAQPPTYVPNRNMMLLSMAAACAEARGIRDVFYGAQAQDEYGYWDCTQEFLTRINAVLALNRRDAITIHAPFVSKSKAEIVALGAELNVDFANTWSCYRGGDVPCGVCPTCVERKNAFARAGIMDAGSC